jgi:hypothetical protein
MMTIFSPLTLGYLHRAGWDENYQADISVYQRLMQGEGCPLPKVVSDFLTHFGNLVISYPHSQIPNVEDIIHFDALKAATTPKGKYCNDLVHYSERIDSNLYAIGEAYRGYLLLMMSTEGKVYAAYDELLFFVGASSNEAIEALCTGKKLYEIR